MLISVPVTSRQDAVGSSALRAADWGKRRAGLGSVWIAHEKESLGVRYPLKLVSIHPKCQGLKTVAYFLTVSVGRELDTTYTILLLTSSRL